MYRLVSTFVCLAVLFLQQSAFGQIEFFHGSFAEARELAKKEHKIIFLDAYASWCGPCKRMAKTVFSQAEAGDFYNKHFVNLKIDMEKGEGPALARKYQVSAYPTLLFIDAEGELVHYQRGGLPIDRFLQLGQTALSKIDHSEEFVARYEEGDRSPELLRAYAYALLMGGKPSLKIANEYIRTQEDWTTKENLDFLFDFALEADCTAFELLLEQQQKARAEKGEQVFLDQLLVAARATAKKAQEFQAPALIKEASKKLKKADAKLAKSFEAQAWVDYYIALKDWPNALKYSKKQLKKYGDAQMQHKYARIFGEAQLQEKYYKEALKWAKSAFEAKPSQEYGQTYLYLLRKLKQEEAAKKLVKELHEIGH
ncbi:thioredoxin family protein [Saprospira grandis]|uniref:Thioredoxin domaiN-containing protein n=1 Tax=Saprospira grandis (strain Lewin) TaxID=984262 RepID=H6L339_SAPGL|nr:thioredoxin fold domain-containing protein [Saprospira grandis]AFC24866.1 thioredoxin domaiN-containing protein [Saprospira grandis str. Lewin]